MATSGNWQESSLGGMYYHLLLPDDYSPDRSYPVLLFLHGSEGEQGQTSVLDPWFNTSDFRAAYPAIIVAPVIRGSSVNNNWGGYPDRNYDNQDKALAILQSVMVRTSGDSGRVYVTGVGIGGYGSWDLMIKDNIYNGTQGRIFAAGLPLAGAWSPDSNSQVPDQATIDELRSVPIWSVVGYFDATYARPWSESLASDLGTNSAYHFTEPTNQGHDLWDKTYPLEFGKPYYDWMFSQAAPPPISPVSISGTGGTQTISDTSAVAPFSNAVISDPNAGATDTVQVTMSNAANGTLSNLGGGSFTSSTGVYTVSGSAAAVSAAIHGLVFTPTTHQSAPGQTVTTSFTISLSDTVGQSNTGGAATVVTTQTLLGALSVNQQLELIYIAYFNRAADGGGNTFWGQQNVQAQAAGQSAAIALTNIANSFAPQQETIALYPFLGTPNLTLNTPAAQAGLTAFIGSVYSNLFNRVADQDGTNYWVGQITSGAVGLGAAALAIANGATGSDAIEVQNKISVALDFTTRTNTANLGTTAPLTTPFLTAARGVLSAVDGTSLNDASVTAGMTATTAFIAGPGTGHATAAATNAESPIIISVSSAVIDPGVGDHTISFITGTGADTLVLHTSGVEQVSGFNPTTDFLDLRSLLNEANVDLAGGVAVLGNFVTVVAQGADALVKFDPSGHAGGNIVADLRGLGRSITSLEALVAQGTSRIA